MSTVTTHSPTPGRGTSFAEAVTEARLQSLANRRCSRRVRHEVRDGAAVIAFSALASTALAVTITAVLALVG